MRFQDATFRPVFGRVLAVVTGILGLLALVATVVSGDAGFVLRAVCPVLLVVTLTFATFWRPHVTVREAEIEVGNVFSTSRVPWEAIRRIDTKWALTLTTDGGTVSAWASPAPGRYSTLGMTRGDVSRTTTSARGAGDSVRPGDALSSESGMIAHVIRTRWEQLRDDDLLDAPQAGTGPHRTWHTRTLVVTGVLLVGTVLSLIF